MSAYSDRPCPIGVPQTAATPSRYRSLRDGERLRRAPRSLFSRKSLCPFPNRGGASRSSRAGVRAQDRPCCSAIAGLLRMAGKADVLTDGRDITAARCRMRAASASALSHPAQPWAASPARALSAASRVSDSHGQCCFSMRPDAWPGRRRARRDRRGLPIKERLRLHRCFADRMAILRDGRAGAGRAGYRTVIMSRPRSAFVGATSWAVRTSSPAEASGEVRPGGFVLVAVGRAPATGDAGTGSPRPALGTQADLGAARPERYRRCWPAEEPADNAWPGIVAGAVRQRASVLLAGGYATLGSRIDVRLPSAKRSGARSGADRVWLGWAA